jgi:nucleoside-diphosphate-sugar epimerase
LEVYETFSRLFGKHIKHTLSSNIDGKSAGIDSNNWVADITKVKEVFGWEPQYTFEQGLSQYINYRNTNG